MIKDNFLERKAYSDILEKRIRHLKDGYRKNLAFIGDELCGKTSIIFDFLNRFYDPRIIMLYLEARPESLPSFARRFIGVLLYNFLSSSGLALKEDIPFLINKSGKFIPKTVEKIKLILAALERRKKNDVFAELLSLCETLNQETGKFCVVILDEFHNLEKVGIKNLYREWSRLLISNKNTMYVIVSSLKYKAKNILAKNLSLLFGNFEIVMVEPLDMTSSEEYLEYRLRGAILDNGLKDFIVHFTGGYPFYLQVISDALLKINQPNLTQILEDLFFLPSGILHQRFSSYLKRFLDSPHSQDYISILYLISGGHNKLKDIAHILHRLKKDLLLKINHLLELDAVTRSGDFLKINDRVFSFWLKFVYREKLNSLTFDAKSQKALFRENIDGMIEEFLAHAQKPIVDRAMELLRLFEDETMQMEKKKIRLTHFKEIKPLEFNSSSLKEGLLGRSSDTVWIMGFKQGLLTEEDVAEFTKECRKYRQKMQKKIIIAFRDIEANARLKALEEKVLTWNVDNLNQILDLFSKPRIIR